MIQESEQKTDEKKTNYRYEVTGWVDTQSLVVNNAKETKKIKLNKAAEFLVGFSYFYIFLTRCNKPTFNEFY